MPDEFLDDAPVVELEPEEETLFLPALPPSGWASGAGVLYGMTPTAGPSLQQIAEPDPEPAKKTTPGTPGTMSQRPPRPAPTVLTGGTAADGRSVSKRAELPVTIPDDPSLGGPAADGTRRLALAPGALLRALVSLVLHRATTRVELRAPKSVEPDVVLGFSSGELVAIEGPLHQQALSLARAGAGVASTSPIGSPPDEEDHARERLLALVERRELSLASSAFFTMAAERALIARAVVLADGEARFRPSAGREAPPRLGRTGPMLLSIAAALDASVLARVAGDGVCLAPSRTFAAVCEALEPPAEVVALFERATDGVTPVDLARASLIVPGLFGIVTALFVGGGLSTLSRDDDGLDARAAEALVREHARRAEDADYFTLLGVARDADDATIQAARDGRVAMLASLPLDALGIGSLSPLRRFAIEAVEDAARALALPRLRAAYALALAPSLRSAH